MLIKKFNSFALCIGVLISSVCQNVSGAQTTSVNKSDCIVKTENQKDREFSRKIVDVGKKFKNKLANVNDSIPKQAYKPFFAAFGIELMHKILSDGINYYYFNEENKTSKSVIQTEDKKEVESETSKNSSEIIQNEKNKINDFSQTKEKSKGQPNNSIVTPNNQNIDSSNGVKSTDKITEDNSGGSTKGPVPKTTGNVSDSSKNIDTNQEIPRKNSSNDPGDSTTKTGKEQDHSSNDANSETLEEKLKQDNFLVYGAFSDLFIYWLVSLTPKEWGIQKAWYDLLHCEEKSYFKKLLIMLLSIRTLSSVAVTLIFIYDRIFSSGKVIFIFIYTVIFPSVRETLSFSDAFKALATFMRGNYILENARKSGPFRFSDAFKELAFCSMPMVNSIAGAVSGFQKKSEDKLLQRGLRALRGFAVGYVLENSFLMHWFEEGTCGNK